MREFDVEAANRRLKQCMAAFVSGMTLFITGAVYLMSRDDPDLTDYFMWSCLTLPSFVFMLISSRLAKPNGC